MFTGKIEKLVYINNKILRNFQLNAIETILEAFKNGHLKVSANLLPGTGKSLIIAEVLKTLFENKVVNRVLFLSGRKIIQQERIHFYENNYPDLLISEDFETFRSGILMKTISFIDDEFNSNDFDLIITDDFCQTTVKSEYLEKILNSDSALLSLNNGFGETYFSNSSKVFNLKFDKYQQYIEFSELHLLYHYNPQFTSEAEVKVLKEKVPENINLDNEIIHTFNANAIEGFVNYNYRNGGIYGYYEGTLIYLNDYYYNIVVDDTIIQLTIFQPNEERLETLNQYLGKKVCGYAVMMFKQDTMYGTMVQISLLSIEDAK